MRRTRLRVLAAVLILLVLFATTEPFRTWAYDGTPARLRHAIVGAYTLLLPTPGGTADLEPMPHVGVNPYAINVFLEQEVEEAKVRRSLEMIQRAGFGWIKQQLLWAEIEHPAKGRFVDGATGGDSWAKYDRIVDLAAEYGLGVIFRIDTSPKWARPDNPKLETPPDRIEDYGEFVGRVAARYRGRVRYYQIWNEPNLPFEWGGAAPDPTGYTRMLRVAHDHVRAADAEAAVLSAAMAPTTEHSEHGMNELLYIQAMYDAGARDAFEVLGVNAYGLRSGPDDRRLAIERDVNFSRPILVRRLMVRNGDAGKPMWASEIGWNALPEDFSDVPLFGRVDRLTQASYTVRAYERAREEWPWMGLMALWHFRLVRPDAHHLQQYYFNAVDQGFEPLPLYHAMRELTHRPRVMHRGYRQEDDWTIQYDGAWKVEHDPRAVLGGYREARATGASLTILFRGTDVELVLARLPGGGALDVTVDGVSLGGGRLDLNAQDEEWKVSIPVGTNLPDGRHLLEVRAVNDRPVRLDAVVVDRRVGWPGLTADALVLFAGVVALCAAVGRVVWRRR